MRGLAFLLAFLFAGAASARTVIRIPTEPDAHVQIQIECCFSQLPASGYAPVDVTINNSSGQTRTWNLQFLSNPSWAYSSSAHSSAQAPEAMHYSATVTVEPGAARTFKLLAPLSTSNQASPLNVVVSGYGLPNDARQFFPFGPRTGKPLTPSMVVSDGAAAQLGKNLEEAAKAESQQLLTADCRADELPDDWRALSGFAGIWLLDSEWSALLPSQRTAVEDWVATGGTLFLCAKAAPPPPQRKGLGSIVGVTLQSFDRAATRAQWREMPRADIPSIVNDDVEHWTSAKEIGVLKPNLPLLISFLGVFAAVVGPVNLFVFAGAGKRSRLFWTVPLISLGATGLLFILIIVQDGFGGRGIRSALIYLVPSARKAVVFQEQISRTGVLGSAAFSLRDPSWVTMVNLGDRHWGRGAPSVQNSDTHFGGEWFKSRSLQSQWIESVLPTRAEVVLVNADAVRDGHGPPAIVSSIAAPLSDFWFRDFKGDRWHAANVQTGVRTVLSPGTEPTDFLPDARIPLRHRLDAAESVRGNFVAVSESAASFIDTLPSIRWSNRQAVYVGPVTGAEPPK